MSTSGSTIGTSFCSWQREAYRASACAFAFTQAELGRASVRWMTARHFAKRAPIAWYSLRRSRRPSSPSVTVSLGEPARGFAPVSTLIPGRMPWTVRALASGLAIGTLLTDRFVIHDGPADKLGGPRRGKEHFPVGAPALLARLNPQRVESPRQRGDGLVGRQDSFSLRNQRQRDAFQIAARHRNLLFASAAPVAKVRSIANPQNLRPQSAGVGITCR